MQTAKKLFKDVKPMDFVDHLSKWTDRIAGYTTGLPPVTFRFLTARNNYAMITIDYADNDLYSKDSEVVVSDFTYESPEEIIVDLEKSYYNSTKERKKAETTAAKHRAERSKRNTKIA